MPIKASTSINTFICKTYKCVWLYHEFWSWYMVVWRKSKFAQQTHRRRRHPKFNRMNWNWRKMLCVYAILRYFVSNCAEGNLLLLLRLRLLVRAAAVAIFISLLSHHIFIAFVIGVVVAVIFHMLFCLRDILSNDVALRRMCVRNEHIRHDLKCETV